MSIVKTVVVSREGNQRVIRTLKHYGKGFYRSMSIMDDGRDVDSLIFLVANQM